MFRVLVLLVGLLMACPVMAQEKTISIRWFGQSFFQVTATDGTRVVFDPHAMPEYDRPTVAADMVVISHEHNDHNRIEAITDNDKVKVFRGLAIKGKVQTFTKIDEKFKNIQVRTVSSFHDGDGGVKRGRNAIFCLDIDGYKVVHLGDLGHTLEEKEIKEIGPVDILMIPVGGVFTINGEAAKEVVKQLKPRLYILPMHYGTKVLDSLQPPDEFLEGEKHVRKLEDNNTLMVPLKLKLDNPTIVLLGWK